VSIDPVSAGNAPLPIDIAAGDTYFWCTCGRSANQPFCDGAHAREETGLLPLKWTAPETKTAYFCACKSTQNAPLCDGSHNRV
jgi:CDGSH-type Zn-finger protein